MKEQDHIRNRIKHRQGNYSQKTTKQTGKKVYRSIISLMLLLVISLALLSFGKSGAYKTIADKISQTIPVMTQSVSTSFLAKFLPFEKWFPKKGDQVVSKGNTYLPGSKENFYTSDGNQASTLYDGLVVYIGDDNGMRWIVIHHDNGLYATYGQLSEINVKLYDRVLKSDSIGVFDSEIKLEFLYNNEDISYEEALSIQED